MVRSPHHHARIRTIDTSEAEKHPGVARVLTHKDVPHNVYTILILIQVGPEDEQVLADGQGALEGRGGGRRAGRQPSAPPTRPPPR